MERGRKLWGMKDKIYSVELKHLPLSGTDYMKIIAILYIYFPLVKSSPSVTVKVEVVCEVGPGRALRDKLRWYMTHGDSIKTLDLRHLEKWRSPMLGSCDIYKIKLFFLNIWSYISCFPAFPVLPFSFPPLMFESQTTGPRSRVIVFQEIAVTMVPVWISGTRWSSVFDKCTISDL